MYQARPRCCLASANRTQFRLFGRCKAVPHPLQRMPEKHLARQGVLRSLCGLKTVLGVVLAQLDLWWHRANLVCTPNASQGPAGFPRCHQCPFVTRSGECVQVMSLIFSSYTRAAREMSLFRFALDRVPPDFSCLSSIWDQNPRLGPSVTALSPYCNECCDPRGRHGSISLRAVARAPPKSQRGVEVGRP